jgi:hypothetical protein
MLSWLLAFVLTTLDGAPSSPDALDRAAADLAALSPDPAPETITNATHYWVSNERRLDLFADGVRDLGGVYLGVGSDQSYVLAGWARAELAVIVDFDEDVVDLHAVYGVLFSSAETPGDFRALWTEAGARRAEAALERAIPDRTRRTRLLELYRAARPHVSARFDALREKLSEAGERWFLDDPTQYAHIRALHRSGRVIAIRGDFRRDGVLPGVARTLEETGLRVRVLYLSNIEQYFMYDRTYKENLLALPVDERSIVLRTLPGRPAGFEYIEQSATSLHAWLRRRGVHSVYRIRGLRRGESLTAGQRHVMLDPPP